MRRSVIIGLLLLITACGSARPCACPPPCVGAPGTCTVIVLGQVARPGFVGYRPGMGVVDAVRAAGGRTVFAARRVNVRRGNRVMPVPVGAPEVLLAPGDVLFVPDRCGW